MSQGVDLSGAEQRQLYEQAQAAWQRYSRGGGFNLGTIGSIDGSSDAIRNEVAGIASGLYTGTHNGERLGTTGDYGHVQARSVNVTENARTAIAFFRERGWSEAQALGITANLIHESGINPHGPAGDGGRARGIAQWHPDRRANFQRATGVSFEQSTLRDQLAFVDWELNNTERAAGASLRQQTDARSAAAVISTQYERPLHRDAEASSRAGTAAGLVARLGGTTEPQVASAAPGTTPASTGPVQFRAIGDSIAVAAINGGAQGTVGSTPNAVGASAATSRTPRQILDYIRSLPPGSLAGQHILLSSGASNDIGGVQLAADQIRALRERGATTVTVVGVGPRPDYVRADVNGDLQRIAAANGAAFTGELQGTGGDMVHPGTREASVGLVQVAQRSRAGLAARMQGPDQPPASTSPTAPTVQAAATPAAPTRGNTGALRTASADQVAPQAPAGPANATGRPAGPTTPNVSAPAATV